MRGIFLSGLLLGLGAVVHLPAGEPPLAEGAFDGCGGIRLWNILGAYLREPDGFPAVTEIEMRRDYLTDGSIWEKDFVWKTGATIATDFQGSAASFAIDGAAAGRNPGGIPTVFAWTGADGRVWLDQAFQGPVDWSMAYAQTYVVNTTAEDLEVHLGASSDDSIQVILNNEEVWIDSQLRGGSDACFPQDHAPDGVRYITPLLLWRGPNSLVVKVFNLFGGWDFSVRFEDSAGRPLTAGLEIRLDPDDTPRRAHFHRGDPDGDGTSSLTDAIFLLNRLFLGGAPSGCAESADANDDGVLNISDPVGLLQHLFLGGPAPPAPGPPPAPCGPDPEGSSDMGCETPGRC